VYTKCWRAVKANDAMAWTLYSSSYQVHAVFQGQYSTTAVEDFFFLVWGRGWEGVCNATSLDDLQKCLHSHQLGICVNKDILFLNATTH